MTKLSSGLHTDFVILLPPPPLQPMCVKESNVNYLDNGYSKTLILHYAIYVCKKITLVPHNFVQIKINKDCVVFETFLLAALFPVHNTAPHT